ncbi:hypothetical protein ABPG72_000586 [Tetrahymena utriculariae]
MKKELLITLGITALSAIAIVTGYLVYESKKVVVINNPPFPTTFPQHFSLKKGEFLLNDHPLYIAAGEIHFSRVPHQYWRDRVKMIKALGLNTLSVYIMWNYHEIHPGVFDFESDDKNLRNFLQIAKEEQMYVLIRPGPYVCAEWDFGGHPYWLLKDENIELRSTDPKYLEAITLYLNRVAQEIEDYQITKNGTIILLQVENEFGYYGKNNKYPIKLQEMWESTGKIKVPYYTVDKWIFSKIGHVKGAAFGLNPGTLDIGYWYTHLLEKDMPVMSSETYPGWLTHWGQNYQGKSTKDTVKMFENIVRKRHSFSIYMVFGGSNFGLNAGANNNQFNTLFQPDITSYDYDAPINEQGAATEKYYALREMFQTYFKWDFPPVPQVRPVMQISPFTVKRVSSLWQLIENTPKQTFDQPKRFEFFDQNQGIIAYTFEVPLVKGKNELKFEQISDYARIYLTDSKEYLGTIDRIHNQKSIVFSQFFNQRANITVIVEAFGHVNFGKNIYDPKGIFANITINKNQVSSSFSHQLIPLQNTPNYSNATSGKDVNVEGFFQTSFNLDQNTTTIGDTYLDMSSWGKGYVWVNGFNLGRFWSEGPQQRLFCPSTILQKENNQIVILDLLQNNSSQVSGQLSLK